MKSSPERVLHIAPTPFFSDRGCHIRIRGIVLALQRIGIGNLLVTYPIGREIDGVDSARCARIPGYTKTEAGPSAFKYAADLLMIWTTAKRIRSFRPELLHCHLHEGLLIGWLAKWLAFRPRLPLVFDMQGSLVGELDAHGYFNRREWLRRTFSWLEQHIVRRADFILCSSQGSADLLKALFNFDTDRVVVARDGADVTRDSQGDFVPHGIEPNRPIVIYTGGLTEAKGLGALKSLFLIAHQQGLPMQFLVIGYPVEELERFVEKNGMGESVSIQGQVSFDKLGQYLAAADIALEPKAAGSGEASGKIVNYMGAGLPVVCYDTPNNRDILNNDGYFAEPGNVDDLLAGVQRALTEKNVSKEIATRNRQRVTEMFSWDRTVDNIMTAYKRVL